MASGSSAGKPLGIIEGNSMYLLEELVASQLCLLIKHLEVKAQS